MDIKLVSMFVAGRSPSQLFAAVFWRVRRFARRRSLPLLRKIFSRAEESWICSYPRVSSIRVPNSVAAIWDRGCDPRSAALPGVNDVLDGWVDVPGFGLQPIRLCLAKAATPNEARAHRLLWRLDFLRPLVRASLLTEGNSPYLAAVQSHLLQWHNHRRGPGSWDSVDEAIRVLNLIETLGLQQDRLPREARLAGLKSILDAAWTVQASRARTGNHLIYEGLALYYAGTCLSGYHRAKAWRNLGRRILEKAMRRQVGEDGMHAELCTSYHLITGTNFLKAWVLGKKTGYEFSDYFTRRLARMVVVAFHLRTNDGGFFALGDSDCMTGSGREEIEARAFAELGRILSDITRGDEASPELRYLLAGVDVGSLARKSISEGKDVVSAGGYHILRGDSGGTLVFDAGPFGMPGLSHHGHADSLSFEAHLPDCRFLVDPGGFSYVDRDAHSFARSTAAHNTIRVDGQNSTAVSDLFDFGRGARAELTGMERISGGLVLSGQHDGYAHTGSSVIHRRGLVWLNESFFFLLVADRLEGVGHHNVEAFFHADSGWEARQDRPDLMVWSRGDRRIYQAICADKPLRVTLHRGQTEPVWQGWVARTFGEYEPAFALVESCAAELPVNFINVFFQSRGTPDYSLESVNFKLGDDVRLSLSWRWINGRFKVEAA